MLSFDLETFPIRRPVAAPRPVCVSWADAEGSGVAKIADKLEEVRSWLRSGVVVGHNISYDMACLIGYEPSLAKDVFDAYRDGRVEDTLLRQQLLDIASGQLKFRKATGGYNLGAVGRRYELEADKENPWRMRYGDLDPLPLEHWPQDAVDYSREDAVVVLKIAEKQAELDRAWTARQGSSILSQSASRARKAFGLHLTGIHGLRTNAARVDKLRVSTEKRLAELRAQLVPTGLVRANGTRNTKLAQERLAKAYAAKGEEVPITKTWQEKFKGKIQRLPIERLGDGKKNPYAGACCDRDAAILSGDEVMVTYSEYVRFGTILPRVIDLALGADLPLQPRYDALMETGRSSASAGKPKKKADLLDPYRLVGCQIQNFPRGAGPRECLEPREGNCFILADYDSAELHGIAQVCKKLFGYSKLGELLNAGIDVHSYFASKCLMPMPYEQLRALIKAEDPKAKEARQAAKAIVYGVPGLMGAKKLVLTARKQYGVKLTEQQAASYKQMYLALVPELQELFNWISGLMEDRKTGLMCHPITGFWRGGATASALSNHTFQHLIAEGALEALFHACMEPLYSEHSPLYRYRPVAFCHDEIVMEGPIVSCDGATRRLSEIMEREMNLWTPDYPTPAEGLATMIWSKKAKRVVDARGLIVPWGLDQERKAA